MAENGTSTSHTAGMNPTPENTHIEFNETVIAACESIVENYRKGQISKGSACQNLVQTLQSDDSLQPEEVASRDKAYKTYISQLDEADRERGDARQRGHCTHNRDHRLQARSSGEDGPEEEEIP